MKKQKRVKERVKNVTVDPKIMAAAKRAKRPGEVLMIVSKNEVRLVPKVATR